MYNLFISHSWNYGNAYEKLTALGFRVVVDDRNEKLGYRMREAQIKKTPIQLVLGDQEMENNQVNVRRYNQKKAETMSVEDFVSMIQTEVENKS